MKFTTILKASLLAGVLLCSACKKNPITNDNKPVETTIQTNIPTDGIDTSGFVRFNWNNEGQCNEFRFSVDGNRWSEWSTLTKYSDLFEEGDHTFELQSRLIGGSATIKDTVTFTVNAVKGPAVYLYPRKTIFEDNSAIVTVTTKGLPESHSMKLVIKSGILSSVSLNPKFDIGADVILLTNDNVITLGIGPQSQPIQGDMTLLDLTIKPSPGSDTTSISISECIVRDSNHNDVTLKTVRGAIAVPSLTISEN